ncbi:MAG: ComF family protein [Halanaerobium sp.]
MKVLDVLKDLVYPEKPVCLACGRKYDHSEIEGICDRCLARFSFITDACPVCGREVIPATLIEGQPCPECKAERPPYNFARSVFTYSGYAREVLLEYKYGHRPDLADPFSHMLFLYYDEYFKDKNIDYLIPVPMHGDRKTYRGYNQAARLAEALSKKIRIEYKDVLLRVKNSLPLYTLTKKARKLELEGAFELKENVIPSIFKEKNILIIDDIITTGTTSSEISHFVLQEMEAANVYVLTTASVPVKIDK